MHLKAGLAASAAALLLLSGCSDSEDSSDDEVTTTTAADEDETPTTGAEDEDEAEDDGEDEVDETTTTEPEEEIGNAGLLEFLDENYADEGFKALFDYNADPPKGTLAMGFGGVTAITATTADALDEATAVAACDAVAEYAAQFGDSFTVSIVVGATISAGGFPDGGTEAAARPEGGECGPPTAG